MVVHGETVKVGSRVRVRDADGEDEFTIVADCEADVFADRISAESPFGRALLGHQIGQRVMFRAPGGMVGVTVVAVS
jgi:transcription elongation factor GreA